MLAFLKKVHARARRCESSIYNVAKFEQLVAVG
jgi:hypothetical protein